ncbi:hypothetical protein [Halostella sp. PRR32]|uniref:hypothetical protein n=1 Tax=Halostella sp. PRR32 TaxID=3098147 RepID=UPI002B1DC3EA|nr:hypothetical protein [Halostella sp. PRR32]
MGLFEEFGRQVEQFKQTAKERAEETANFRCRACDARFNTDDGQCPECGAAKVESTKSEE